MEVQTRSETNGLSYFSTVAQAVEEAMNDKTIWKISFGLDNGERIRLIRNDKGEFIYQDLLREVLIVLGEKVV